MNEPTSQPAKKRDDVTEAWVSVVVGVISISLGVFLCWIFFRPGLVEWWEAQSWKEVPCKIIYANLRDSDIRERRRLTTDVLYEYEVAGQRLQGRRASLIQDPGGAGGYQTLIHAKLREYEVSGKTFRCLVNPANPKESVVFNDLRWQLMLGWSPLLVALPWLGVHLLLGASRTFSRRRELARLIQQYPGQPRKWKREWAGPAVTASPDGLGYAVMVCLWLVVIYTPLAVTVIASGILFTEPAAALVFLPFLVLMVPWMIARRRLRARRIMGRVTLTPVSWPVAPGDPLRGQLRFTKQLPQGTKLLMNLQCRREVPHRRGSYPSVKVLWEHSWEVPLNENGEAIMDIRLPADLPGTDWPPGSTLTPEHRWLLEVGMDPQMTTAKLPLPVFGVHANAGA